MNRSFGRSPSGADRFRPLSDNERLVLGHIRHEAPLSRAELSRRTSLALPTVSRLTDQLVRDGLVVADQKVMMGRMGQPSLPFLLAPSAAFAFGIAVRVEAVTVSLTKLSGMVVATMEERHDGLTREQTVAVISTLTRRIIEELGVPSDRVCGGGIALPGFFINDQREVNAPLGMEDWAGSDLKRDLEEALGMPMMIENDGSAAALGERLYGCGTAYRSFAYLYIDRGLGGGLILDGKLSRGTNGNAGEFTGLLSPEKRGVRPTLELLRTMLADAGEKYAGIADLLLHLDARSHIVAQWVETVAATTTAIMSAIAAILDPDAIIIGGRLPPDVATLLIEQVSVYSVPVRGRDRPFPKILPSSVLGDAASLGASALPFDRLFV